METTNLKKALEILAKRYQTEIVSLIESENLEDTGKLKNSIKYSVEDDSFQITSDSKYAYLLGSNGYLKRWGRPPAEKLAEWAKRKGIRPRDKKGRFKSIKDYSYKSLGFAIARSISGQGGRNSGKNGTVKRFGYRGSRIIQKVNKQLEGKLAGEIMDAYKLDFIQGMKQEFKFNNIKIQ